MNVTADVEDEGEDEEEEEVEEEQHRLRWQSDATDKWWFHDHTNTQADTGHSEEEGKPPPVIEACAPQPEIGPGGWDRVQVSMRACNFGLTGWLSAYVNCCVAFFCFSPRWCASLPSLSVRSCSCVCF